MKKVKPDVIAKIRMYTKEEGGKDKVITGNQFGCPFYYGGDSFDCRLLLKDSVTIGSGDIKEIPIKFLFPEYVKSRLKKGDQFELWDAGIFADGQIIEVLED